jgi:hypothetical protein
MTGQIIDAQNWQESLYDRLAANELVYQLDRSGIKNSPFAI